MRNRLVHHYEDVSAERVHAVIGTQLDDFDTAEITDYADRF